MNLREGEELLRRMIELVKQLFYGGHDFRLFETYIMVPRLNVVSRNIPDATLTPYGAFMGVEVTRGLMNLQQLPFMFAVGHELGHGFSQIALFNMDLAQADGCVTEVIADLGAAYVLHLSGVEWRNITAVAVDGEKLGIFDQRWSGHHPPGRMRADCVLSLAELMQDDWDFELAAKAVCLSMQGRGPGK